MGIERPASFTSKIETRKTYGDRETTGLRAVSVEVEEVSSSSPRCRPGAKFGAAPIHHPRRSTMAADGGEASNPSHRP